MRPLQDPFPNEKTPLPLDEDAPRSGAMTTMTPRPELLKSCQDPSGVMGEVFEELYPPSPQEPSGVLETFEALTS